MDGVSLWDGSVGEDGNELAAAVQLELHFGVGLDEFCQMWTMACCKNGSEADTHSTPEVVSCGLVASCAACTESNIARAWRKSNSPSSVSCKRRVVRLISVTSSFVPSVS